MKTLAILAASLLVIAMPAMRGVRAQTTDGTQVATLIERNAGLLAQATELVQETNSTRARSLLQTATSLQRQSEELLANNQLAMAGRVALRAREAIQQTIATAKRDARLEDQTTRVMERAVTRLEQARSVFEESGRENPNARRLIFESADNLRRAQEQRQEHMFETSLRLAEASLMQSTRAIRMLRRDGTGAGADAGDEIDRTQRVLDRATEVRPSDPARVRLLEQATEMQTRAIRAAERGDALPALEQTRGARDLALRVLRGSGAGVAPAEDVAMRAIGLTDEILEGARALLAENPNQALARRVEEAGRQQEDARRALADGDFDRAAQVSMNARAMIRGALQEIDVAVSPESAGAALARTDAALDELRAALSAHDNAGARDLLERATARQRDARAALQDGEPKRALALTRVAHNLARTGLDALNDADR
ncbi:MAG TPA: hypothetical protein VFX92_09970 [Candidatus Krumholzibacteria bacterium]|nr:hypothetical protein [Candidatus Krumholzibacteria bacterium]